MIDFSQLKLEWVIFHRVYPHYKKAELKPPQLSQKIIALSGDENTNKGLLLKDEIIKAASSHKVSISFDDETSSTTPTLIRDLLVKLSDKTSDTDYKIDVFLKTSFSLAHILNETQDARNSSGIFALMYGRVLDKHVIIVAKLEEEIGLQLNESTDGDIVNIDIKVIENLIRLHKANVLKIGIFYGQPKDRYDRDVEIEGFLCDPQNPGLAEVADFYLRRFLGCVFTNDSRKQTKEFFEATSEFIKDSFESPIEQIQRKELLSSILLFGPSTIKPREFIQEYIPEDKQAALERMYIQRRIEINGFTKDTEYISKKAKKMKINFENGVTLTGFSEHFNNQVSIQTTGPDETTIIVKSAIKNV